MPFTKGLMRVWLIFGKTQCFLPMRMRVRMPADQVGYMQTFIVVRLGYTGMEIVKALLKCF
jgi:hypothetical protein